MKIDIHVHTKKTKSGDPETRNIGVDDLTEILCNTEVGIIGITNHNYFDLEYYIELRDKCVKNCQIWPGVELDVVELERRGHVLVLVAPNMCDKFYEVLSKLSKGKKPENFEITIEEMVENFDSLNCLYIPHFMSKTPALNLDDIEKIERLILNKNRLLKDAGNPISAGIYVNHGHNSIYGSDVKDWSKYIRDSISLPDLRLAVESFEQFCLLLDKDEPTINTLLESKKSESLILKPFKDSEDEIKLNIYNDINIIFGSKGTGKTDILDSIAEYYSSKGFKANVFKSNEEDICKRYDLLGSNLVKDFDELGLSKCSDDINIIKNKKEVEITNISKYYDYFSKEISNGIAKKIKIKEYPIEDASINERKLESVKKIKEVFIEFNKFSEENPLIEEILDKELFNKMIQKVKEAIIKINSRYDNSFRETNIIKLFNHIIETYNIEISKKTGHPLKPTGTGFKNYAHNRIEVEKCVKNLISNIEKRINPKTEYVGDLGDKGKLFVKTDFVMQNGKHSDGSYKHINSSKKTPQKEFASSIFSVKENIYDERLFENIAKLNSINEVEIIKDVDDLVLFRRYFILDEKEYKPSTGEASMILLQLELKKDLDIYLLDEPEKSLGNDYINDVIVPLLKEKAKIGKRVVVATHDANIAVRTLPYNSIYRSHGLKKYHTYIGNPFSNNLVEVDNNMNHLDWKIISMKTLEGGPDAFGERGKIYGK